MYRKKDNLIAAYAGVHVGDAEADFRASPVQSVIASGDPSTVYAPAFATSSSARSLSFSDANQGLTDTGAEPSSSTRLNARTSADGSSSGGGGCGGGGSSSSSTPDTDVRIDGVRRDPQRGVPMTSCLPLQ